MNIGKFKVWKKDLKYWAVRALTIKQRKWKWLGHTLRKEQVDITNQSLKWNLQGYCKVGRPKSTWKRELQNELIKEINKTLSEASAVATSREKWKDLMRDKWQWSMMIGKFKVWKKYFSLANIFMKDKVRLCLMVNLW